MKRIRLIVLALGWALACTAQSAELSLLAEPVPGSVIATVPGGVTPAIVMRVAANSVVSDPEDYLAGWQLAFQIIPTADAQGTVQFESVTKPQLGYIFDGLSSFGVSDVDTDSGITAFDALFPFNGGVKVPVGAGLALLNVETIASVDASGTFQVFALAGLGASEWTDSTQSGPARQQFANLPDSGGPLLLAEIVVSLAGDYNNDGTVNSADYTVWRDNLGAPAGTLYGDADGGPIGLPQYQTWRANFGATVASQLEARGNVTVPEPGALILVIGGIWMLAELRSQGKRNRLNHFWRGRRHLRRNARVSHSAAKAPRELSAIYFGRRTQPNANSGLPSTQQGASSANSK